MSKTKKITFLGVGIALYVVMSMFLNIPLIGHIRLDCGYIVYSVYLAVFGWLGIPVGVIGCFFKGYISDGWIPFTWMIGQTIIGVVCAVVFSKTESIWIRIVAIVLSVFFGIAIVSSGLSALIFHLPIGLKIFKGCIAAVADILAMIVGLPIGNRIKKEFGGIVGD